MFWRDSTYILSAKCKCQDRNEDEWATKRGDIASQHRVAVACQSSYAAH